MMSSINTTSADKLARLVGTPKCPALVDVRLDEDLAAAPRLIPGATRRPFDQASGWARALAASLGVSRLDADDLAQLEAGLGRYDAFYPWCRHATDATHDWPSKKPGA